MNDKFQLLFSLVFESFYKRQLSLDQQKSAAEKIFGHNEVSNTENIMRNQRQKVFMVIKIEMMERRQKLF